MLYENFVNQRILQYFGGKSIRFARERISVSQEGTGPSILNGLSIYAVYAAVNIHGTFYECTNLRAGEKKQLEIRNGPLTAKEIYSYAQGDLEKDQEGDILGFLKQHLARAGTSGTFPGKGYAVIIVKENPFMHPDMRAYQNIGSLHVIYSPCIQ